MTIQWYPGHMTRARREIAESMQACDVVIEVLDARMPASSENPVVTELRKHKPCLKVLTKADLADPDITAAWVRHLEAAAAGSKVRAVAIAAKDGSSTRAEIPAICARLGARQSTRPRTLRAMVVGVPNVGKSTLINALMGRKVTVVGDEPAVTKAQQKVVLKSGMVLSDTPGILWPKIDEEATAYRLAVGGAIPDTALDYERVAAFAAAVFLERYPGLVIARYKLDALPESPEALLEKIGRRRGCLRSGGGVDMHKAADVLLHEFRAGTLGRISLEAPPAAGAARAPSP